MKGKIMKNLDEKEWAKFDVFGENGFLQIAATNSSIDSIRLVTLGEKIVPYITRTDMANGIAQFVSDANYKYGSDEAGCITIGLDTQTAFYQPHKFVTGQNIQIVTGDTLNNNSAHFYVAILKNQMKAKFNWGGNGATLGRMRHLEAMLPVTESGEPDYEYMSEYVKIHRKAMLAKYRAYVKNRIAALGEYVEIPALSEKEWKAYRLSFLGSVESGRDIYAQERVYGRIPYITAGSQNNGIGYFVDNCNDTYDSGYIAFNRNGAVGCAFYHHYLSVMGNDCRKLHLKAADKNLYVGISIAMLISMQSKSFSYSRKLGTARANKLQIMLPVTDSGEPDYGYMEQYAKNMMIRKYRQYLSFLDAKDKTETVQGK